MAVPTTIADLSTTAASNSPAGSESIGTSLDDYIRAIQAIIKQGASKGSDITAASTITPVATSSYFVVTGSTGITAIGETYSWTGRTVVLKFSGTPVLTHSAALILPGSANITVTAGDVAAFVNESSGVWRCSFYSNGSSLTSQQYLTSVSGADTITASSAFALSAYAAGQTFRFISAGANTSTTPTLNINSLGAKTITKNGTSALAAGDIPSGAVVHVTYDGTYFQLINVPVTSATSTKVNNFRLTLTSATPVTTSDVTGAGTIYACPYDGNQISLYTGGAWVTRSSAQFSLALSALTSGKPYDVFCYDNSGTPTLEFLVWTNDTTRATALAYQDGVLVKSGDATRRYLGTFYTTSTTTTEDSAAKRYLWNYYHRVVRPLLRQETTANWTYTTATWRQANASASNQIEAIQGVAEDPVKIFVQGAAQNSTGGISVATGVGVDSTSTNSATVFGTIASTAGVQVVAIYDAVPAAGRHYYAWLELSAATGTTTWYGKNGTTPVYIQAAIQGEVMG